MKKVRKFIVVVAVVLNISTAWAQTDEIMISQQKVELSQPGKLYTLDASLTSGEIRANGYDGKEILITIYQKRRHGVEADSGTVKNVYTVTATEKNNVVTVRNNNIVHNIIVELKIPNNVKLKLTTIHNARIRISNLAGEMELSTEHSGIRLDDVSGSVLANTINGNIIANFVKVNPSAPLAFSTLNGGIKLSLPVTIKCNVRIKTEKGKVISNFDIDYKEPIDKQDWRNGTINGGGQEFMIKNITGDIVILKSRHN